MRYMYATCSLLVISLVTPVLTIEMGDFFNKKDQIATRSNVDRLIYYF